MSASLPLAACCRRHFFSTGSWEEQWQARVHKSGAFDAAPGEQRFPCAIVFTATCSRNWICLQFGDIQFSVGWLVGLRLSVSFTELSSSKILLSDFDLCACGRLFSQATEWKDMGQKYASITPENTAWHWLGQVRASPDPEDFWSWNSWEWSGKPLP